MRFEDKLSKLCEAKRLTNQRALADSLGISKSTLNRWLSGKAIPDMREALRLARLLEVPLEYLADDEQDEPTELSELQQRLLWLGKEVGYELAIKRVANVPETSPPPGESYVEWKARQGAEKLD